MMPVCHKRGDCGEIWWEGSQNKDGGCRERCTERAEKCTWWQNVGVSYLASRYSRGSVSTSWWAIPDDISSFSTSESTITLKWAHTQSSQESHTARSWNTHRDTHAELVFTHISNVFKSLSKWSLPVWGFRSGWHRSLAHICSAVPETQNHTQQVNAAQRFNTARI